MKVSILRRRLLSIYLLRPLRVKGLHGPQRLLLPDATGGEEVSAQLGDGGALSEGGELGAGGLPALAVHVVVVADPRLVDVAVGGEDGPALAARRDTPLRVGRAHLDRCVDSRYVDSRYVDIRY